MIEGVIPSYSAEGESFAEIRAHPVSPPALRGFFAGLITPINTAGSVWGAAMSRAFATETRSIGWLIPIAVQMIPAVIAAPMIYFAVESPRWLVSKGQNELALKNLRRLRRKEDVAAGLPEAEILALENAIEFDRTIREGSWLDLFRGSMWRRSVYAMLAFFFYQVSGPA
jgi:SP family sugar:H+ symporter-like MFS transporter